MNFDFKAHGPLTAVLIGSAGLLVGCSGEPSNSDIEKALAVNAAQGTAEMERLSRGASKAFIPQLHAARKLGCKADTAAAFVCDVELDVTPPMGVRTRTSASMRFVQGSNGWSVSR